MTGYISRWDREGLLKEPRPRPVIPIPLGYQNGGNAGVNYAPTWVACAPSTSVVTVPLYNNNYLLPPPPPPPGYRATQSVIYTPVTTTTVIPSSPWVYHTTYQPSPSWVWGPWRW
ncbi:hypothetical protein PTI98_012248 [Pleurotus ostreatus]|uniref:Uncharacterized protein n=1 Tax=Pleurotus ostreatus (strain PC15) TaxID=1137138 RepID=A0A067N6D9_PLEO1|nr:hypothetical protein PTI98_012248 [Pleurotus ostreatus]KDQ23608.1 hypothetical protein PLEOSDRAFT_171126 [Pleurotus ostreatus PC15]